MKPVHFITVLLLSLTLTGAAFAGGGSEAGNGGGLSEKNLLFAYTHLADYIGLCVEFPLCRLEPAEIDLLKKIRTSLPSEQKTNLVFRSEKASPGFFQPEGVIRIAKTGDHVADPIYLNTDLLYPSPIDIPLATSILVHELGHHQGVRDHAALDRLGSKMQTFLLLHSQRAEFWNGNAALMTFQFNDVRSDEDKKKLRFKDQIILENGAELFDLGTQIAQSLRCPDKHEPLGVRFYNVHEERGVQFDEKSQTLKKPVVVWYILSCKENEESDHGNIDLTLVFHKRGDGFEFLPSQIKINPLSCKNHTSVCK